MTKSIRISQTYRLDPITVQWIDHLADQNDRSKGQIIDALVTWYLFSRKGYSPEESQLFFGFPPDTPPVGRSMK